jgi:hypothetical protein
MEERLEPPQVVGDVDPVIGLDVAVVVLYPLGPGRAAGFDLHAAGRVLVLVHVSSREFACG